MLTGRPQYYGNKDVQETHNNLSRLKKEMARQKAILILLERKQNQQLFKWKWHQAKYADWLRVRISPERCLFRKYSFINRWKFLKSTVKNFFCQCGNN